LSQVTVSRTAQLVALYRAIESSRDPDVRLFDDPFAPDFLDQRFRWALRMSRLPVVGVAFPWGIVDGHWAGPRGTVAVRTKYIDDLVGDALRAGVRQIAIFGAGFDCRAYRIPGIDEARVFEVDHPTTQARKRDVVARRLGAIPPHVALVPLDLTRDSLETVMRDAGYPRGIETFFICEGVTHYLSASAVDATFRYVATTAARSRMVFTYIHRRMLDGSAVFAGAANTLATVRRAGEPYTFGFEPADLPSYLSARGLRLVEDVDAAEYRQRYLVPRSRQREALTEYQRAALAEVAGSAATEGADAVHARNCDRGLVLPTRPRECPPRARGN
jgi:methyltransferase (TIGR00027 family)